MKNDQHNENEKPVEPSYQLPFFERSVTHSEVFNIEGDNPLFLRPVDIHKFYAIPASTIYDWISQQPTTKFPSIKFYAAEENKRGIVLIPKRLFDQWLIEHTNLMKLNIK